MKQRKLGRIFILGSGQWGKPRLKLKGDIFRKVSAISFGEDSRELNGDLCAALRGVFLGITCSKSSYCYAGWPLR